MSDATTDLPPREPTPEECSAGAQVGLELWATWYPQMGGYVGKAVLHIWQDTSANECFEAWVWHDSDFPFSGDLSPAHLHHCMAEQFVSFGKFVLSRRATAPPSLTREAVEALPVKQMLNATGMSLWVQRDDVLALFPPEERTHE